MCHRPLLTPCFEQRHVAVNKIVASDEANRLPEMYNCRPPDGGNSISLRANLTTAPRSSAAPSLPLEPAQVVKMVLAPPYSRFDQEKQSLNYGTRAGGSRGCGCGTTDRGRRVTQHCSYLHRRSSNHHGERDASPNFLRSCLSSKTVLCPRGIKHQPKHSTLQSPPMPQ